jgi:rubredoxin
MSSEDNKQEAVANVGGAKRKNGHKATCGCHICENIMNKAKRGDYKPKVASGKVNGHKAECRCPICKNMMAKKGKRGGSEGDTPSSDDVKQVGRQTKKNRRVAGGKKSNGHKATCLCPICKNMRSSRMSRRNKTRSNRRH